MDLDISLYGKKKELFGWIELLEQEKAAFRCIGRNQKRFSAVNVLSGFKITPNTIKRFVDKQKVFIFEPPLVSEKAESKKIPKIFIKQEKNLLFISRNISLLLLNGNGNRATVLHILKKILLRAFKLSNLPYVHIWYYPMPCKTAFLLRQDVDYVDEVGIRNLLEITSKFGIKGTYFVNISGEEEFDEQIGHLKLSKPTTPDRKGVVLECINQGNEVSNHGYWHVVFNDFQNNFQNIKRCSNDLYKLFRVKAKGFASPGAEWNINLASAIDKNELLYSCNGLNDGGFPYYPSVRNRRVRALEVPFYFLCDASFEQINSNQAQEILRDYFFDLIERNMDKNEPVAILGHPHLIRESAMKFYSPLFQKINDLCIPNLKIEEFVCWWRTREKTKLSCRIVDNKLIIKSNYKNMLFEIVCNGKSTILQTTKEGKKNIPLGMC